jgi:NAD(P)-dependent dehydrogenase (short-subunit alcohol dehydrogenase family)
VSSRYIKIHKVGKWRSFRTQTNLRRALQMILVTGATGNNGTEIVKRLAAKAHVQVRAMVRNPERASVITLPHVEVVEGDFDRPATLLSALAGVESKVDLEEHRDGVLASLAPVGHLETVLAERVALLSWRLNRVVRYETESIALIQEKAEDDLADRRRFGSRILGAAHPEDVRPLRLPAPQTVPQAPG